MFKSKVEKSYAPGNSSFTLGLDKEISYKTWPSFKLLK